MQWGSTVCVALLFSAAACGDQQDRSASSAEVNAKAPPVAVAPVVPHESITKAPAAAGGGILTLDSLPQRARAALAAQAPNFRPWSADGYDPAVRASLHTSANEGLSIVRGHFRNASTIDYIVAGYERRLGDRIVAILATSDTAFNVIGVTEGPDHADSLADRADQYLVVDVNSTPGRADLVVKPIGSSGSPGHYTWVAARGQFLLVEPN